MVAKQGVSDYCSKYQQNFAPARQMVAKQEGNRRYRLKKNITNSADAQALSLAFVLELEVIPFFFNIIC